MKTLFLLSIIIGLLTSSTSTQERTTMDILTSYKWCMSQEDLDEFNGLPDPDDPDDYAWIIEAYLTFTDTVSTTFEKWSFETKDDPHNRPYYLGFENIDFTFPDNLYYSSPTFDDAKVGKNKNGDYIIEKNKNGGTYVLKILELTEEKLTIQPIGTIGGRIATWYAQPKD